MANIRFLHDNAADRATLTASTTAGALVAANLQRNEKAAIWRSTGTTATITATWTTAEPVDSVVLGWTNLTALASVTVNLYADAGDTEPIATATPIDGALAMTEFAWGVDPLGAGDAQTAGLARQVQVWFAHAESAKKIEIVISDPDNAAGCIEVSRLAAGMRYEMAANPGYGASLGFVDRSKVSRSESGDVRIDAQGVYRTLNLDFSYIEAKDSTFLMRLATQGARSLFVSVFPDTSDIKQEAYAFFATISGTQSIGYAFINRWTNSITLEEIA